MEHADHVRLIRDGVVPGTWADLGSGTGAFTLALAELIGSGGAIVSVDYDAEVLRRQARVFAERFPDVQLTQIVDDFQHELELPPLDGLLMANSLHFVEDQRDLVTRLARRLRRGGRFLLVEYDADRGNAWVPRPVSLRAWTELAHDVGLGDVRLVGRVPSRFLGSMYAAVAEVPATGLPRGS
jgi:SAM-dependent methyltransferase